MADGKLAIVMPSYRFDAAARHCIHTVASMACSDVEVYVGDNSVNPEKWAFLRNLAQRSPYLHVFCHETNLGANGNWLFLLEQQSHEFICMASDDDLFTPDYFLAGVEELKSNPACAAASGQIMILTQSEGRAGIHVPVSNILPTPVERVAAFRGMTTIPYMVHRRSCTETFQAYMLARPFLLSYMDQFFTYYMLCEGAQIIDARRPLFMYNNVNWHDAAACLASDAKFYVMAGLPDGFKFLHHMFWAVEAVHYFNSKYRPHGLSDQEADVISRILFDRHFRQHFLVDLNTNLPVVIALFENAPEALQSLQSLMVTPYDQPERLLSLLVTILRAFDTDLAERYATFVAQSLRPTARTHRDLSA